jgi:hypothetical protein
MRAAKTALARRCSQQLYFFVAKGMVEETWLGGRVPSHLPMFEQVSLAKCFWTLFSLVFHYFVPSCYI